MFGKFGGAAVHQVCRADIVGCRDGQGREAVAQQGVGNADDRGFNKLPVGQEDVFNFLGVDPVAADFELIVPAADQEKEAVGVDVALVAGVVAVLVQFFRG